MLYRFSTKNPLMLAVLLGAVLVTGAVFYLMGNDIEEKSDENTFSSPSIPKDWISLKDEESGYSLSYPPEWEIDGSLAQAPGSGVKAFITKEREPSEGFYIIRALSDSGEASLEYLDANFAKPFREQAIDGTLDEELAGIQGRASISLEAKIKNVKTQETVTAYLLLISSSSYGAQSSLRGAESDEASSVTGKGYAYAISVIARGPKTEIFLEQARLMTSSLRFF